LNFGLVLIVVSVILLALSIVFVSQARSLLLELNLRWVDVLNIAHGFYRGAWILLGVAIVCIVIGAIAMILRLRYPAFGQEGRG
jgi:hypothetical protein